MINLYGIKNCDKVRAAKKWLDCHHIKFQFQDIREKPLDTKVWQSWLDFWGADQLINKRSASWKQLSEQQKCNLSIDNACILLQSHPTLMKRPHLLKNKKPLSLGFSAAKYQKIFSEQS